MGNTDRIIAGIAEGQHSLVTSAELRRARLSEEEIDYRVAARRLQVVHPGVYRMAGVRPYFEQRVLAACLATGGAASHGTAAALFGLRGFRKGRIEITVDRGRAPRLAGVECHKSKGLLTTTIGVVPATVPAQILLDVAAAEPRLAEGALADALVRKVVKLPQMVRFLQERSRSGRPGGVRLRELVEAHVRGLAPTESWLEDRVLEFLRGWGFPEPDRQRPLLLPGRQKPIRFDFAYRWCQCGIEADGRLWHTSPAQRRRDEERDQAARLFGWSVERITWLELVEAPAEVAARIARLLKRDLVA